MKEVAIGLPAWNLEFTVPTTGAFKANLFYMKQYDTMPVIERLADRSGFYIKAPFKILFKRSTKANNYQDLSCGTEERMGISFIIHGLSW